MVIINLYRYGTYRTVTIDTFVNFSQELSSFKWNLHYFVFQWSAAGNCPEDYSIRLQLKLLNETISNQFKLGSNRIFPSQLLVQTHLNEGTAVN